MISLVCILLGLIFLGLDIVGIPNPPRFKFQSAGLFFWLLSLIISRLITGN